MNEYETLFCESLYKKLKKKIKANVSVKINRQDVLLVSIRMSANEFTYLLNDISEHIKNGLNLDYLSYEIYDASKKFILKKYFN